MNTKSTDFLNHNCSHHAYQSTNWLLYHHKLYYFRLQVTHLQLTVQSVLDTLARILFTVEGYNLLVWQVSDRCILEQQSIVGLVARRL